MSSPNSNPAIARGAPSTIVHLPAALRAEAGGAGHVEVRCDTVADALARLAERYPTLRRHLFDDDGSIRRHVNVFVNSDDVRHLGGTAARVKVGDEIHIVPSIAGG